MDCSVSRDLSLNRGTARVSVSLTVFPAREACLGRIRIKSKQAGDGVLDLGLALDYLES